ncbi:MAG: hypothetical protein AAF196_18130 [Planctomycetota bacterium]
MNALARIASASMVAVLSTTPLFAQEPEIAGESGEALGPIATQALQELTSGSWTFDGQVSIKEPEGQGGMDGMMMMPGVEDGESFTGGVMLHRTADDELLMMSESALPGLRLYQKGSKSLVNTTTKAGEPLSLDSLTGDLRPLFRPNRLLKWSEERALWKEVTEGPEVAEVNEAGGRILKAKLPESLVTPPGGDDFGMGMEIMNPFEATVMRAELIVAVTAEGKLQGLRLSVVRSDPAAAMQKLMEDAAMDGALELDPMMLEEMEQAEGATHTYEFSRSDAELNDTAKIALRMFRFAAQ